MIYKITISKMLFVDALKSAEPCIAKRDPGLLSTFHLRFSLESLSIETYNGISGYRAFLNIENTSTFSFCLPYWIVSNSQEKPKVIDLISNIAELELQLSFDESKFTLEIAANKFKLSIQVLSAQDYVCLDNYLLSCDQKSDSLVCDTINKAELKKIISKLLPSVSKNNLKLSLQGICFKDGKIWATDGHKLTWIQSPIFSDTKEILLNAFQLNALLSNSNESLELAYDFNSNLFQIKSSSCLVFLHSISEQFPDCKRIIPNSFSSRFLFPRNSLIRNVEFLSCLTNTIVFKIEGDSIVLKTRDVDQSFAEVQTEGYIDYLAKESFPEKTWGFNPQYLLDLTRTMEGEMLIFETNGYSTPFLISLESYSSEIQNKSILMPIVVKVN